MDIFHLWKETRLIKIINNKKQQNNNKEENSTMIAPCKDCTLRQLGCHSTCFQYKSWKQEVDRVNSIMNQERRINNVITNISINKFNKIKKRKTPANF